MLILMKVIFAGPPGPPGGVYVEELSVTAKSVRLVWTVTSEIAHGEAITGYDIEAETHYHPDVWKILMTGKNTVLSGFQKATF